MARHAHAEHTLDDNSTADYALWGDYPCHAEKTNLRGQLYIDYICVDHIYHEYSGIDNDPTYGKHNISAYIYHAYANNAYADRTLRSILSHAFDIGTYTKLTAARNSPLTPRTRHHTPRNTYTSPYSLSYTAYHRTYHRGPTAFNAYLYILTSAWLVGLCSAVTQPIHVAGLLSDAEHGILPALHLAIKHINARRDVLPGYRLNLTWNDTKCDMAIGVKQFFEQMHDPPFKTILLGDTCSKVSAPIAETATFWEIRQISYADTDPVLSDRIKYPYFFRTVPSERDYNQARVTFALRHNWRRVGLLYQQSSFGSTRHAYAHAHFIELLVQNRIEHVSRSFRNDPRQAIEELKAKDIRILFGNFDSSMAERVMCSAYHSKLFGPKHVWILLGDMRFRWWSKEKAKFQMRFDNWGVASGGKGGVTCDSEQLELATRGHFVTEAIRLSTDDVVTVSGLTPDAYRRLYERDLGSSRYNHYHGYAYDSLWTVALAVHRVLQRRGAEGGDEGGDEGDDEGGGTYFRKHDFRSDCIQAALNETDFLGVTGRVKFSHGDRIGQLVFRQRQLGSLRKVAEYDTMSGELDFSRGTGIQWQGNTVPRDGSLTEKRLVRVPDAVFALMCCLSGLGIVVAVCFLSVNIHYRKHRSQS